MVQSLDINIFLPMPHFSHKNLFKFMFRNVCLGDELFITFACKLQQNRLQRNLVLRFSRAANPEE